MTDYRKVDCLTWEVSQARQARPGHGHTRAATCHLLTTLHQTHMVSNSLEVANLMVGGHTHTSWTCLSPAASTASDEGPAPVLDSCNVLILLETPPASPWHARLSPCPTPPQQPACRINVAAHGSGSATSDPRQAPQAGPAGRYASKSRPSKLSAHGSVLVVVSGHYQQMKLPPAGFRSQIIRRLVLPCLASPRLAWALSGAQLRHETTPSARALHPMYPWPGRQPSI